ncbi:centrosomal protein 295 isoform X2 [Amia ocellicauda]
MKMKRKVAKVARLRLSPNEEAQLLKEEQERRRKLRLQQVREQERSIALQIRREVQHRRDRELQQLAGELRAEWQREQAEKLRALERLYQSSLQAVGEGHRSAHDSEPDWAAIAQKAVESNEKAEERHRQALKELKTERQKQHEDQNRRIKARRKALLAEKERAAKVASLPPPPPDPLESIEVKKLRSVKMSDVDSFSVTRYHLPEACVDREGDKAQLDARAAALEEARRLEELEQEEGRERGEQLEKARLRGSHALRMVQLSQDRERLLTELEQMQQADLARRRQVVVQMPPQLFVPPYRRQEIKEDWQRDLEIAFEDMYSGDRRVKGDLVLRLAPEPLPTLSTGSQDGELDVTLEPVVTPSGDEQTEESQSHDLPRTTEGEAATGAPKQALKRLLSKIRTQRDQWSSRSEAETDTAIEAMTIESGSLTSEDQVRARSSDHRDGHQLPTFAQHTKGGIMPEESIVAGSTTLLHPKEQAIKMRSAAERRKQEEELEQKKQEQIALLQQLEEQKRSLEVRLQEAQQDKQRLQALMQENLQRGVQQPSQEEEPVCTAASLPLKSEAPLSSEDEHLQKIHQYQQRLLEQNRLHKQSVEEVRQRLEDYKQILKRRYPSLSTTALHPVPPDALASTHPTHFQEAGVSSGHLDTSLMSKEMVDVHLEKRLELACFENAGKMPPGPSHFDNVKLPVKTLSNFATKNRVQISESENAFKTQILPGPPIPTSASSTRQLKSNQDSKALKIELHSGRDVQPDSRVAGSQSVHQTSQGSLGRERSEADIRRFIEVYENHHESPTQIPSSALLGASEVQPQRMPLVSAGTPHTDTSSSLPQQQLPLPEVSQDRLKPDHCTAVADARSGIQPPSFEAFEGRDTLLVTAAQIQAKQQQLCETQERLDRQREAFLHQQRVQEESLLQKQHQLKEQMRPQACLEMFLVDKQPKQPKQAASVSKIDKAEHFSLSALLRAVEQSDRGPAQSQNVHLQLNLSPQANQSQTISFTHQTFVPSSSPSQNDDHGRVLQLHRPHKPPLAKPRLGILDMIEQHELSAIQEVETPMSDGFPIGEESGEESSDSAAGCPQDRGSFETGNGQLGTSHSSEISSSGADTGQSSRLSWRERLFLEACSAPRAGPPTAPLPSSLIDLPSYSSDIGQGVVSFPGPLISSYKPRNEAMIPQSTQAVFSYPSMQKMSDPECLSSTTISTGSFSATELDFNSPGIDSSTHAAEFTAGKPSAASPSRLSSSSDHHSASSDASRLVSPFSDSVLHSSSIQRIIDKYTKELNHSLDTVGSFHAPSAAMDVSDLGDSNCHISLRLTKHDYSQHFQPLTPRTDFDVSSSSSLHSERNSVVHRTKDSSQDFDISAQRLIGTSASMCIQDGNGRHLGRSLADISKQTEVMENNSGHFLPLEPRPDFEESSSSSQQSERPAQSTSVEEMDCSTQRCLTDIPTVCQSSDSAAKGDSSVHLLTLRSHATTHQYHSIDVRTDGSSSWRSQGRSFEDARAETSSPVHQSLTRGLEMSVQHRLSDLAPVQQFKSFVQEIHHEGRESSTLSAQDENTGVEPSSESFCPLQPEITLNEIGESSFTFNPAAERFLQLGTQENQTCSSDVSEYLLLHAINANEHPAVVTRSQEDVDLSRLSEEPIEHLRCQSEGREPDLQESVYQLVTSRSTINNSVLSEPPVTEAVKLVGRHLGEISLGDARHSPSKLAEELCSDEREDASVLEFSPEIESSKLELALNERAATLQREHLDPLGLAPEASGKKASSKFTIPFWEAESGRGIMEEPELTLMSLNETTLQEEELTSSNGEETTGDRSEKPVGLSERLELENTTEDLTSKTSMEEDRSVPTAADNAAEECRRSKNESSPSCAVMLLEFPSSAGDLQERFLHKKNALIQKSAKRVEEIKTRSLQSRDLHTSLAQSSSSLKKAKPQPSASVVALKKVGNVKVCTPEQRKDTEADMYQRTQRLYNQLDEVKRQKEIKMRQEASLKNREKAKEFQQKTLQKLRAKRTLH